MTSFEPADVQQRRVIESQRSLTVVIGGAGSGKTTCAAAAAHAHLSRQPLESDERVLFLSFSRASVTRITDRSREILGPYAPRVDVTTFHALAWSLVRRFGSLIGKPAPVLMSPAMSLIYEQGEALQYDDLIPGALSILNSAAAVRRHTQRRWGFVIVDEYQDTNDIQEDFLRTVAAEARVMLLGDPNQCIYSSLPGSVGVSPERLDRACELAGTEGVVRLSEASHRDPSGVIPASAAAILRRDFTSPAIRTAISTGRLTVRAGLPPEDEARIVAETVQDLRSGGRSVAVFSHHNDMLANLSDALQRAGIAHEIAGLSDSLAAALAVQLDMLRFSSGQCEWNEVLGSLAVFVTSATRPVRGQRVPALAYQILSGSGRRSWTAGCTSSNKRCRMPNRGKRSRSAPGRTHSSGCRASSRPGSMRLESCAASTPASAMTAGGSPVRAACNNSPEPRRRRASQSSPTLRTTLSKFNS
jgi:DNA helicase II / ATP-dependent DNA helicase PcrA